MAALTKTSFRLSTPFQQSFNRSFHASSANMTIKAYFECTWTGPQMTCDATGKVTSKDENVVGKSPRHSTNNSSIARHPGHRGPGLRGGNGHHLPLSFAVIVII